jgi:two-component system cell cycle sensor histidine kinase/response regulator CckA
MLQRKPTVAGWVTLQVLTTLMVNGIAAMPSGGKMRLCVGGIDLSAPPDARCAPGRYLTIAVIDQGAGIAREKLPRLFEPFYAEGHEGGLGLMLCQSILGEQGGLLTVESEPGVGSTFTLHLPMGR